MIDLQKEAEVCAVQINYHDYQSNMYGRYEGLYHRYYVKAHPTVKIGRFW